MSELARAHRLAAINQTRANLVAEQLRIPIEKSTDLSPQAYCGTARFQTLIDDVATYLTALDPQLEQVETMSARGQIVGALMADYCRFIVENGQDDQHIFLDHSTSLRLQKEIEGNAQIAPYPLRASTLQTPQLDDIPTFHGFSVNRTTGTIDETYQFMSSLEEGKKSEERAIEKINHFAELVNRYPELFPTRRFVIYTTAGQNIPEFVTQGLDVDVIETVIPRDQLAVFLKIIFNNFTISDNHLSGYGGKTLAQLAQLLEIDIVPNEQDIQE